MAIVAKRTIMSLFSDTDDVYSHQVRIVLAEKGVNVEILAAKQAEPNADLLSVNPYGTIPTLIDRELVLYEPRIIMEYLDERFPHPPLLPVYPVARAETRKMMHRIEHDWYYLMNNILRNNNADEARTNLFESLVALEPVFADKPYFLSDEFSLLDCALAPLLWRLPRLGIDVAPEFKGLIAYMQRLFKRESFQASLTDVERQLRAA
ncbi:glutathione S-transferase N-terminal domain-containing protein [Legionella longbeachae]|uniref:Putative stringent starvation protein A n=1 Tax=Legionella longbeachae serogroup 1 (strain NSW150) TaxID=661367 RepID=D3HP65_LEGLN|nr:glutathione S-transferase N-terminal domain-containing protein [Legionella longbeachae]VEE01206.1 stringent starvation protein A [Legionella oakridgensis]HBD7398355.1 stringent starvation protein A [Legionella pneumophila]ARB92424.1 stringent starvation protein A [Legionella longbeachae]ARM34396.1 stringent starvation protein A [Legionella longbeachae]EEZ96317.1 stringent starvation protein A [Legionella longbeachae D-4968]